MRDNDDITREIMEAGLASAIARGASAVGSLAAHATGIPRLAQRGMGTVQGAKAYNQIRADWNRWAGSQGGMRGVSTTPDNLYAFAQDVYGIGQDEVRPVLEPLIREYIGSVDVDALDDLDEPAQKPFGKRTTPPGQQPAAAARPASGTPPNPPASAGSAAAPAAPAAPAAAPAAAAPDAPASPPEASASAPAAREAPASPEATAAAPEAPTAAAARAPAAPTAPEAPPTRSFGQRKPQTIGPARTASGREVPADRITRIDPATGKPLYRHNSNGVNFDDPTLNDPETTTKSSKQTAQARRDATRREKTRQISNDVAARKSRTESVINPIGKSFSQIITEAPSTVSLRDIEKGRAKATDARNKEVFRQRDAAAKAEKNQIDKNDAAIRQNIKSLGDEFFKSLARKVTANPQKYRAFMGKTGQEYTGHSLYGSPSKLGTGAPTSAAQTQTQSQGNIDRGTVNSILTRQFGMKPETLSQVRDAIKDMSPKQAEQWVMSHQNNRLAAQVLVALLKATQAR